MLKDFDMQCEGCFRHFGVGMCRKFGTIPKEVEEKEHCDYNQTFEEWKKECIERCEKNK